MRWNVDLAGRFPPNTAWRSGRSPAAPIAEAEAQAEPGRGGGVGGALK
ncbi:hypothetical protein AB0F18_00880 [Streptomyces sp. NPDC029216]